MSSDSDDDNITLKEYQSRLQASSSKTSTGFDISMSEYDDSDRDNTWKPTKEDLLSSSDDIDSDHEGPKHTQKKNQKIDFAQNSHRGHGHKRQKMCHKKHPKKSVTKNKFPVDDVEIICASILEDDILKHVYNKRETDHLFEAADDTELLVAYVVEGILENVYKCTENDSNVTDIDVEMLLSSIIEDSLKTPIRMHDGLADEIEEQREVEMIVDSLLEEHVTPDRHPPSMQDDGAVTESQTDHRDYH